MIISGLFALVGCTSIQSGPLFLAIHLVQYAPDIRHTSVAFYSLTRKILSFFSQTLLFLVFLSQVIYNVNIGGTLLFGYFFK